MICNGQLIAYFTCQSDQSYASFSIYWWRESYTLTKPSVVWSRWKCMTWCSCLGETYYYQQCTFSTCSHDKNNSFAFMRKDTWRQIQDQFVFMGCSRVDHSVKRKRGLISCWLCACSCKMFLCLCGILRHSVKYSQYLPKAVDNDFIFIAPLFTHCWLCRL